MISFIQYINESSKHEEEEEHQRQWEPHEKMRISQRILNVKRGETSADKRKEEKAKAVTRTKAELDDSDTRLSNILRRAETEQGHKQPSLVMSKGKDFAKKMVPHQPSDDHSFRQTTALSNIDAKLKSSEIADIIKRKPYVRKGIESIRKGVSKGETKPKHGEEQASSLINMAKREKKMGGKRRQREARGQGRLFPHTEPM